MIQALARTALLLGIFWASGGQVCGQEPDAGDERVLEHQLENGWRFLIYQRRNAPTISFETYVPVGTVDDPPQLGGLTLLLKNLLFKGSARIGTRDWDEENAALAETDAAHAAWLAARQDAAPEQLAALRAAFEHAREHAAKWSQAQEWSRVLEEAGCGDSLRATCDQSSTRLSVSLPANQFELWCWMESERFRDPVFREFFGEKAALMERSQRAATQDSEQLIGDALRACAYGEHVLGRPSRGAFNALQELDRATAMAFFREHYGAARMVTAIVGDVEFEHLIPLLDKYFGSLPSGPRTSPAAHPRTHAAGERRVQVPFAGEPRLWIAWHVPGPAHPDSAAIEVAMRLLGHSRSSRLRKRIKRSLALDSKLFVDHNWGGDRQQSLALIGCALNLGAAPERLEEAIDEELQRLTREGPGREELAGVKRVARAEYFRSLRDNEVLAAGLTSAWVMSGRWQSLFERDQRLVAVQARQVQRVLREWFTQDRRALALLAPSPVPASAAPAEVDQDQPPLKR